MKKTILILVLVIIPALSVNAQQQLQLSTYYPAPYGRFQQVVVGDRVLITPQAAPPANCEEGQIYVSSATGTQLCQGGNWIAVGGWSTRQEGSTPIVFTEDDTARIGIGTSDPQQKLHIVGNVDSGGPSVLRVESVNAGGTVSACTMEAQNGQAVIGTPAGAAYPLSLMTDNTDRLVITSDGRVGVGTNISSAQLGVGQPFTVVPNIAIKTDDPSSSAWLTVSNQSGSSYSIGVDASGNFLLNVGTQPTDSQFIMDSAGNITIKGTLSINDSSLAVKLRPYTSGDAATNGYYATYAP